VANEFKLPDVGEGIESGVVVGILVAVGDTVEADQPVLELETDKAVVEVPSSVAGTVQEIHVAEGDEAKVGQVILTLGEEGAGAAESGDAESGDAEGDEAVEAAEDVPAKAAETDGAAEGAEEAAEEAEEAESPDEKKAVEAKAEGESEAEAGEKAPYAPPDAKLEREGEDRHNIPAAPSVRRLAREMGVDLSQIGGSGLAGRISADDVRRAAEGGQPSQAAPARAPKLPDFGKWGEVSRQPMSGVRRATAKQMALSWSNVPHVTQFDKADITELEKLRKAYAKRVEAAGGGKLTPTASILKVAAAALKVFSDFGASIDVGSNEIVYKRYVHIGVAVDTKRGLLVPVIRDADKKNIIELSRELNEAAERARGGKTSLEEMQGGTFTITNLGGIGGTGFTPIVNHPEVAILGVSKAGMEPVWMDDAFQPRLMMPLSLSYDHRLIDGASAARFLRWICEALEQPFLLALEG
jgi:pyruvate dehydrogenase E2 component (dihydrolipoamide acetyltransferase)